MNTFFSLIQRRRSIRKYKSEPISVDLKKKLQEVALMSPASKRSNPWEFIFIENKETLEKLSECKPHGAAFLKSAALAIVVIADPNKSDVWVEDTSIASIYLQLAAEDMGLGSCWIQIHKRLHSSGILASDFIKNLLNIPLEYEVESIISIGYKDEERKEFDLTKAQYERIHNEIF